MLLLIPAAAGATAAIDEYSLGQVGGQSPAPEDVQREAGGSSRTDPVQRGVLGENEAQSPLAAASAIILPGLGVALLLGGGLVLAARSRSRRGGA